MMKLVLLLGVCVSIVGHASPDLVRQLTTAEYKDDVEDGYRGGQDHGAGRTVQVSPLDCQRAAELRAERPMNLPLVLAADKLCQQSIAIDGTGQVTSIRFENATKNRVNPRTSDNGSVRSFQLNFAHRSIQNMNLKITEDSGLTGNMSHDLLESSFHFVPRRVVPYLEVIPREGGQLRRIYLPTNESFDVRTESGEIVGGVLAEDPMDMTLSRHDRRFAGLRYLGRGIMIRADRRAGTPEHIYAQSFNRHERIREATLTHAGKTCYVPKELIWENAHDANKGAFFRYGTDQEFLDQVVNPRCKWNLKLSDLVGP